MEVNWLDVFRLNLGIVTSVIVMVLMVAMIAYVGKKVADWREDRAKALHRYEHVQTTIKNAEFHERRAKQAETEAERATERLQSLRQKLDETEVELNERQRELARLADQYEKLDAATKDGIERESPDVHEALKTTRRRKR